MTAKLVLENVAIDRPLIEGRRLTSLRVLAGVSFAVPAGGRLAVLGPSGAGKTSLLRVMNRLDDPAAGRILLNGDDLRRLDPIAVRRRVGMLFQQPLLFDLTVDGNLAYPLQVQKQSLARDRAEAALREVGLPADVLDRRGQQLSGGQQQRVALARALLLDPEVLLLDEPTSALDEESAESIMQALLRRNRESGMALVMVSHARHLLRRLECPVLLVHAGQAAQYPGVDEALGTLSPAEITLE